MTIDKLRTISILNMCCYITDILCRGIDVIKYAKLSLRKLFRAVECVLEFHSLSAWLMNFHEILI